MIRKNSFKTIRQFKKIILVYWYIRSIQVAILDWWQVDLVIRHEKAMVCTKSLLSY